MGAHFQCIHICTIDSKVAQPCNQPTNRPTDQIRLTHTHCRILQWRRKKKIWNRDSVFHFTVIANVVLVVFHGGFYVPACQFHSILCSGYFLWQEARRETQLDATTKTKPNRASPFLQHVSRLWLTHQMYTHIIFIACFVWSKTHIKYIFFKRSCKLQDTQEFKERHKKKKPYKKHMYKEFMKHGIGMDTNGTQTQTSLPTQYRTQTALNQQKKSTHSFNFKFNQNKNETLSTQ